MDMASRRRLMVEAQVAARGVRSPEVLAAMERVPREAFVEPALAEFAYEDTPLPADADQTLSQPYIVALMVEALALGPADRVLEVGTGTGYAAAVLAEIAGEVYTIERHAALAEAAAARLRECGYPNVQGRVGDGTLGWPDAAPFDGIAVTAGGPIVPPALLEQLAIGGRLVIPVGKNRTEQSLLRVVRTSADDYAREDLGPVCFVPLIGDQGWKPGAPAARGTEGAARRIAAHAERFGDLDEIDLDRFVARVGDARVVLLGEATHGTSQFYELRDRMTRALVHDKGFSVVAVEADWTDAARIDAYVRDRAAPPAAWQAFARFPTWMWRNQETKQLVDWLRGYNERREPQRRVRFAGLDLYGLHQSIAEVLSYLDAVDADTARVARERYACLTPWQSDPAAYGLAALSDRYRSCERDVVAALGDLLKRRMAWARRDDERFFDAERNARVVAQAERYYRTMYYGAAESWNLRDDHMFETLCALLAHAGEGAKAVVWAHNSHVGDARATEMRARGERNVGELCRRRFGASAYAVGFGTHSGTVASASAWDGPLEIKDVRPSHPRSYEFAAHASEVPRFLLPLRRSPGLRDALAEPRLERAIGVIYRPENELASHYLEADLTRQFDEWAWFDKTRAIRSLDAKQLAGVPETYPFGL
jgi:protein-L-isoaspartate(D-aspartate) O-methyltransferase